MINAFLRLLITRQCRLGADGSKCVNMNVEEFFEQWSDIEESGEIDSSSDSEEQDIDYENDKEQSWR